MIPQQLTESTTPEQRSLIGRIIWFCLTNKLVVALVVIFVVAWGLVVAPFAWDLVLLPRDPVPADAIPDLGENQQIVFAEWPGRSPQDVEDQITYPLTTALMGIPGVKSVRSYSMFGFSSVYVIFDERWDFYWTRSRVLERVSSLPAGTLPEGVRPSLGPDATALGQVFWYTLEGRDPDGNPAGGWDLEELRTIQDWYVRYGLLSAEGVSEVASVGGFVRQYQVDVDPDAMRAYHVTIQDVARAVRAANLDVGAGSIEINRVEYLIRGVGFVRHIRDIEDSVVKVVDNVPVLVRHVATVQLGPASRAGALDKEGAEAVGGVVVARYGSNPLAVIKQVKAKIQEISAGLPEKVVIDWARVQPDQVQEYAAGHGFEAYSAGLINHAAWLSHLHSIARSQWPDWITTSKLTIVPFYDRTGLIYETLGTLRKAITEEILVTIIVVILMAMHLRSSILISGLLPIAVLMCFIAMKTFGVDANIVALSGIAIAIGTMVDMGIILCENILRHLGQAGPGRSKLEVVHRAASEVGTAVLTAVATTVVGFLPVFAMSGAEGKLFKPLAFTKTFALLASLVTALTIIPPAAHILFCLKTPRRLITVALNTMLVLAGLVVGVTMAWWAGTALMTVGLWYVAEPLIPDRFRAWGPRLANIVAVMAVTALLALHWEPLGPQRGLAGNLVFVGGSIGLLLGGFLLFQWGYRRILGWCLRHKFLFLTIPAAILILGGCIWLGFGRVFGLLPLALDRLGVDPDRVYTSTFWVKGTGAFPGLGREFMPPLEEGSFLWMPSMMPHASIGEALDIVARQDMAIRSIPEVESVVGKIGRAETALDPAPVSMVETVINYKPEYITDRNGHRMTFKYDHKLGRFLRDDRGQLIPDPHGLPFRQWRDQIRTTDDIWRQVVAAAQMPGVTSAPKLQPIAARIVMLQSGIRAPMGVKIKGPSLEAIEQAAVQIEQLLKDVPAVEPSAVIADRIVGKPYLEIVPDRLALARYGISIVDFQEVVEAAIGGMGLTTTVEGRHRFPVRIRYQRQMRDQIDALGRILVAGDGGVEVPLGELAQIRYVRGPQMIKSEDTFLTAYVLFDKRPGYAEVDVVESCKSYLDRKKADGQLILPAGVSYGFAGSYENHIRSQRTLALALPGALFAIFLILYLQFRSVATTSLVFSGIMVAWAGGFVLIWLYGQGWFLDLEVFGVNLRELFQVHPINLSVAVWVGFLALFGIASDDGVVISTYLDQTFRARQVQTVEQIRQAVLEAGMRRVRPCLMTTATTVLALMPVLTSTGRGADIMVPMAIPCFGGMIIEVITMLIVPVLYCAVKELRLARQAG